MYILLVYEKELSKSDYLRPLLITIIKSIKKLIKKIKKLSKNNSDSDYYYYYYSQQVSLLPVRVLNHVMFHLNLIYVS